MTRAGGGALALGLTAALVALVALALPLWTVGVFGSGVAPAVRQSVLWRTVWSGYGNGDSASISLEPDVGGAVLVLGVLGLVVGVAVRRQWAVLVALAGGALAVTWSAATLATAVALPTDPGPVAPGGGLAAVGVLGAFAAGAVLLVALDGARHGARHGAGGSTADGPRGLARRGASRSATLAGVSNPEQPWNTPHGAPPSPGYGWGPQPGQPAWEQQPGPPAWGPQPGRQPGSTADRPGTPVVLWTGIAAVLVMVVSTLTGLYTLDLGQDLRQVFGTFTFRFDGNPASGSFRPDSISFLLGLATWVSGAAVARLHRVVGLALAASGAAVVLAYTIDFAAALVYNVSAGPAGVDLRVGGWLYLLLLPVAAGSVVLALVGVARRDR